MTPTKTFQNMILPRGMSITKQCMKLNTLGVLEYGWCLDSWLPTRQVLYSQGFYPLVNAISNAQVSKHLEIASINATLFHRKEPPQNLKYFYIKSLKVVVRACQFVENWCIHLAFPKEVSQYVAGKSEWVGYGWSQATAAQWRKGESTELLNQMVRAKVRFLCLISMTWS